MVPFSAGAVLARSFSVWLRNLAPFLVLTLLITLPGHALSFAVRAGRFSFDDQTLDLVIPSLIEGTLLYLASGAICWAVFEALRGRPISFAHAVSVGLRRLPAVLAVGVTTGLVVGIAFLALVIPGLLLLSVLYVVIPAAVLERSGVAASVQRSARLTAGNRLTVFVVVILTFAMNLGIALLVAGLVGEDGSAFWTAHVALAVVFGSFGAVTSTVVYYDLRRLKEGASLDDVTDVFG